MIKFLQDLFSKICSYSCSAGDSDVGGHAVFGLVVVSGEMHSFVVFDVVAVASAGADTFRLEAFGDEVDTLLKSSSTKLFVQ